MIRPRRSSSWNTSHVAQRPTRFELAMSTRGASGWVVNTPTGFPDCTSSVSSSPSVVRVRQIASNEAQSLAAFPVPPYTTRSCGRSATSGSRLFMSMRSAASWTQPRHDRARPRSARTILEAVTVRRRRSLCPRVELALSHPGGYPLDIGGEWPIAGEGRHLLPQRGVRASHAMPRLERLQEFEPLRPRHELDRDDAHRVGEDPPRLPGGGHPHGHDILMIPLCRHRLHTRGRGEYPAFGRERRGGDLRCP